MSTLDPTSVTPTPQVIVIERRGNGLAVAALVLGIVGSLFGLFPITFFIALTCGIVGLGLGIPSIFAAKVKGRRVMAWIGTTLSAISIALGVVGIVILNSVLS